MKEYDMNDPESVENLEETLLAVFMPCMKKLGDVDDLFAFRSLIASFIENWSIKYDYDPMYIAISTANMMAEVHCTNVGEYADYDDEDEDEEE